VLLAACSHGESLDDDRRVRPGEEFRVEELVSPQQGFDKREEFIRSCKATAFGAMNVPFYPLPPRETDEIREICSRPGEETSCLQEAEYRVVWGAMAEIWAPPEELSAIIARFCEKKIADACPMQRSLAFLGAAKAPHFAGCRSRRASDCGKVGEELRKNGLHDGLAGRFEEEACLLGSSSACAEIGRRIGRSSPKDAADRDTGARSSSCYFILACEDGDGRSCERVLDLPRQSCGLDRGCYDARDRRIAEALCRRGSAIGCYWQAVSLQNGSGGVWDPTRARQLLEQACKLGEKRGCEAAAAIAGKK
jgi:hypothetical protein